MSSVVIYGDTSGAITLAANAIAGTNTLTIPALTGTLLTTASTGTVLQVLSTSDYTNYSSSSTSFTACTNLAVTITPKSATSKIFVIVVGGNIDMATQGTETSTTIYRNAVNIGNGTNGLVDYYAASTRLLTPFSMSYLDSPATTSATTYTVYFRPRSATTVTINNGNAPATITAMEIAV